jgi:hypothetical protein
LVLDVSNQAGHRADGNHNHPGGHGIQGAGMADLLDTGGALDQVHHPRRSDSPGFVDDQKPSGHLGTVMSER